MASAPELWALWSATKTRPNPGGLEQVWLDFLRGHGAAATEWIGWMKVGLSCARSWIMNLMHFAGPGISITNRSDLRPCHNAGLVGLC